MSNDRSPKATAAEVSLRVKEVQDLQLKGKTRMDIQQYMAENHNLSERTIDEYIKRASEGLTEMSKSTVGHNLAVLLTLQHNLLNDALIAGDRKVARQIIMDIAKLRGLDQITINHIVDDKRDLELLHDDDLNTALEEAMNGIQ